MPLAKAEAGVGGAQRAQRARTAQRAHRVQKAQKARMAQSARKAQGFRKPRGLGRFGWVGVLSELRGLKGAQRA